MSDATKVLVVDDEDRFREVLAKRLALRGFDVQQAGGGLACLELLETWRADVVVLDVKMPDLDGLETLRRIHVHSKDIPVILLTGHASTSDGVEGIKAGAYDYLTKPVELDHLTGKIRQASETLHREKERQREAAFRRMMEERMAVAERLASLGTLAAGVAHEINNPLAVINDSAGWLTAVLQKDGAPEPLHAKLVKGLSKIQTSVDRARRITHQLLGFARKQETDSEVDVAALAREALRLVDKEARNRGVAVALDAPEDLPVIWSDPYRLRQVVLNLVTNALQATPADGSVRVTAAPWGDGVELSVADTGQGIAPENLERIFEPFFSTKPPGEGTGLGLYVSNSIVRELGGTMEVQSELGQGAQFTIRLPKTRPTLAGDAPQDTDQTPLQWQEAAKNLAGNSQHEASLQSQDQAESLPGGKHES